MFIPGNLRKIGRDGRSHQIKANEDDHRHENDRDIVRHERHQDDEQRRTDQTVTDQANLTEPTCQTIEQPDLDDDTDNRTKGDRKRDIFCRETELPVNEQREQGLERGEAERRDQ